MIHHHLNRKEGLRCTKATEGSAGNRIGFHCTSLDPQIIDPVYSTGSNQATLKDNSGSALAWCNLWQLAQVTGLGLFFLFSRHIRLGRLVAAPGEVGAELEAEESEYRSEGG